MCCSYVQEPRNKRKKFTPIKLEHDAKTERNPTITSDVIRNLSNGLPTTMALPPLPSPMEIPTPILAAAARKMEPPNDPPPVTTPLPVRDFREGGGGVEGVNLTLGVDSMGGVSFTTSMTQPFPVSSSSSFTPASFSPSSLLAKRDEYVCTTCSKTFRSKEGWKIHMERHEGKSRYHCHFCQRGFMAQTHLKAHLSEHTNELPCECDQCGLKFKYPFTLKKHRMEAHPPQ